MGLLNIMRKLFKKEKSKIKISSKIYHNQEIDPILTKENDLGLTPGEIVLLDWSDNKSVDRNLPQYFKYSYDINGKKSLNKLMKKDYLDYGSYTEQLNSLTVKKLKDILYSHEVTPRGRKADLIEQIIQEEIQVKDLPQTYSLTDKGTKVVEEYDYIVRGHKEKYIETAEILKYKKKRPNLVRYGDLKWGYLNEQGLKLTKEMKFGLVRNNYMYKGDQLLDESKYINSLVNYIVVILFDASGLDNDYENSRSPSYSNIFMAGGIFQRIEKAINNGEISEKEYEKAFERALKIFEYPLSLSLLSKDDLNLLKKEIYKLNSEGIEEYLKKYE